MKTSFFFLLMEEVVLKSWWVMLFFFTCCFFYEKSNTLKKQEKEKLTHRILSLEKEIAKEEEKMFFLKLSIENRLTPSYLELILMEKLNLIPKGYKKLHLDSLK